MAKRIVWVGLVEAKACQGGEGIWRENFGDAAGGFTTAVAYASSAAQFKRAVVKALTEVGADAVAFQDVETLESRRTAAEETDLHEELVAKLAESGVAQLGDFFSYGSEDFESSADWLESMAKGSNLNQLQREALSHLARMLKQIDLPLLDGVDMAHDEERIVVDFTHREGVGSPDLAVSVGDADILVDYELSHAHFGKGAEERPLDAVYEFLLSALQGGVKVEVWERPDGTIDRTRTYILDEDRAWEPFTAEAPTPTPSFVEKPSYTKLLSFVNAS